MKWQHSDRSKKDYDGLQPNIQKAFDKQAHLLAADLLHPSLHAKNTAAPTTSGRPVSPRPGVFFSRSWTTPTSLPASSPTRRSKPPQPAMLRDADESEPEYPCPVCGRTFRSFARLDDHLAEHEGPRRCRTCSETIRGPYHPASKKPAIGLQPLSLESAISNP